jgi:hypothetical protein
VSQQKGATFGSCNAKNLLPSFFNIVSHYKLFLNLIAEQALENQNNCPGLALALLEIVELAGVGTSLAIRIASAEIFKNLIKNVWSAGNCVALPPRDKQQTIKALLMQLMTSTPADIPTTSSRMIKGSYRSNNVLLTYFVIL